MTQVDNSPVRSPATSSSTGYDTETDGHDLRQSYGTVELTMSFNRERSANSIWKEVQERAKKTGSSENQGGGNEEKEEEEEEMGAHPSKESSYISSFDEENPDRETQQAYEAHVQKKKKFYRHVRPAQKEEQPEQAEAEDQDIYVKDVDELDEASTSSNTSSPSSQDAQTNHRHEAFSNQAEEEDNQAETDGYDAPLDFEKAYRTRVNRKQSTWVCDYDSIPLLDDNDNFDSQDYVVDSEEQLDVATELPPKDYAERTKSFVSRDGSERSTVSSEDMSEASYRNKSLVTNTRIGEYRETFSRIRDGSKSSSTTSIQQEVMESIASMDDSLRRSSVIISGLLYKKSRGLFHRRSWKLRFAVLTSESLKYYTEEYGRQCGEISLKTCNAKNLEVMPPDSSFDGKHATMWRFALHTNKKRLLFAAYDEREMNRWLRGLRVAFALNKAGASGRFTDLTLANSKPAYARYRSNQSLNDNFEAVDV